MRMENSKNLAPSQGSGQACDSGCGQIATERNRYYTGRYLAARDFQDEQAYHRSKAMMHNRALHGWGVVCGLDVARHPDHANQLDTDCARRWVVVHPGFALDCCGRELVVDEEMYFELPLPEDLGKPRRDDEDDEDYRDEEHGERHEEHHGGDREEDEHSGERRKDRKHVLPSPFLLGLEYQESLKEFAPALYEGACDTKTTEANRILEGVRLVTIPLDELQGDCWGQVAGHEDVPSRDDCAGESGKGTCLEPGCPCGSMVPLALITYEPEEPEEGFELHMRGRRRVPASPEMMTHIVWTSWRHGEEMSLEDLREAGGRLSVRFDRKLHRHSISPYTFMVQYGGVQRELEFMPYEHSPRLDEETEAMAVFTIRPHLLHEGGGYEGNLAGTVVYITLKCDFILDCHHNPVDGNHLRGQLPSGDGVPGGTFESWFRIVSENRGKERPR